MIQGKGHIGLHALTWTLLFERLWQTQRYLTAIWFLLSFRHGTTFPLRFFIHYKDLTFLVENWRPQEKGSVTSRVRGSWLRFVKSRAEVRVTEDSIQEFLFKPVQSRYPSSCVYSSTRSGFNAVHYILKFFMFIIWIEIENNKSLLSYLDILVHLF